MTRYANILGGGVLAAIAVLFVLDLVKSPVKTDREAFDYQVAYIEVPELDFGDTKNPEFEEWQRIINSQPKLWEPLFRPQPRTGPPPNLAQQLAGVFPTRNEIGVGPDRKVQIQVDGQPNWYTVGQQIKGCAIKEITNSTVVFSVTHGGQEYGIALPRR